MTEVQASGTKAIQNSLVGHLRYLLETPWIGTGDSDRIPNQKYGSKILLRHGSAANLTFEFFISQLFQQSKSLQNPLQFLLLKNWKLATFFVQDISL